MNYKLENLFGLVFQNEEVVGELTFAYYDELENSWDREPELFTEKTLEEVIKNVDDRILYNSHNGKFLVVEHGEEVGFNQLWSSERYSVLEHLKNKLEIDLENELEKQ